MARPRSRCTWASCTEPVEGPRCFWGREATGHRGGAQKRVSQRSGPFPMPSERRAHQFSTTALTTVPYLPPHASLAPPHHPSAHLSLTSNTHAHTSFPLAPLRASAIVYARGLVPQGHHDCQLRCSLLRAGHRFSDLHREVGHSLGQAVGVGLPLAPAQPCRSARSARSTCTSATWPRRPRVARTRPRRS